MLQQAIDRIDVKQPAGKAGKQKGACLAHTLGHRPPDSMEAQAQIFGCLNALVQSAHRHMSQQWLVQGKKSTTLMNMKRRGRHDVIRLGST